MKNITFTPQAYKDYLGWLREDKKIFTKITELIQATARNPLSGIGNPEKLKHELSGYWSRRINQHHRLVYQITEETIYYYNCFM